MTAKVRKRLPSNQASAAKAQKTKNKNVLQVFRSLDRGEIDVDTAQELLKKYRQSQTTRFERWMDRLVS